MIFDTHAHLDMVDANYIKTLVDNARNSNVKFIVCQSVNLDSAKKTLEIVKKYPDILKFSLGIYPGDIEDKKDLDAFYNFALKNKKNIYAIGEIGMDFSYEKPSKEVQEKFFRKQLELANKLNVPVSIHTRKAEKEVVEILKDYPNVKKILHCFSARKKVIEDAISLGCYFSIPANIVRSQHFQMLTKMVPKDKILTETDTPYLSPFKDKKNEPANIKETIKTISKIWNCSLYSVEKQIEENFFRIYN